MSEIGRAAMSLSPDEQLFLTKAFRWWSTRRPVLAEIAADGDAAVAAHLVSALSGKGLGQPWKCPRGRLHFDFTQLGIDVANHLTPKGAA